MKNRKLLSVLTVCTLVLCQCANRGSGPQGGPKDETPPQVVKSTPENGATGFNASSIVIEFNENISVDNPVQNVIVSPPQVNRPNIKGLGRKVIVNFQDTLLPETTYSINFGNSIVDYNESNPLPNYTFLFSTGQSIDSLRIQGQVVDAQTLAPVERITVGIYADETDSTFATTAFNRIAVTDKNGKFSIEGIHEGRYSIYAVQDLSNVYHYLQPGPYVAFCDSLVNPYAHVHATMDTVWTDTAKTIVDSVIVHQYTAFGPAELELRVFKEQLIAKKFSRSTRERRERFNLVFTDPVDELPTIRLLDTTVTEPWYVIEKTPAKDSLLYWITDSALVARDTLQLAIDYPSLDESGTPAQRCDSTRLVFRKKKGESGGSGLKARSGKKNEGEAKPKVEYLEFSHNLQQNIDYFDSIRLVFNEPFVLPDTSAVHLSVQENDSVWTPVDYRMQANDSVCPLQLQVVPVDKPDPEKTYKIQVDSLGIRSLYGKPTNRFSKPFQFTKEEDYANLFIKPAPTPENAVFELLNEKNEVVETQTLVEGEAAFYDKKPGNYKLRMYIDGNGNGRWDTGSIKERRQPETVYNCPKTFSLRANWDVEETWEYLAAPKNSEEKAADKTKKLK